MMNNYKKYIKIIPACVALMSLLSACDDDVRPGAEIQPEGENTVISLTLTAPDFTKRVSRADMSEEDAFTVNTLWVGIYNANDRKSTIIGENNENGLFLTSADEFEHGFTAGQKSHGRYTIKNITTKSGPSYIVAVANPDVNYGYKVGESAGSETLLLDLLQNASTWDDFLAIAIKRDLFQGAADVQMPNATQNPLPMSGIYLDDASHADDYDWDDVSSYYIPLPKKGETSVSLDGSIHLRRPFTQVKFNIEAAGRKADGVKIIKIEPESFTVHNVPLYGWLYERPQDNPSATNLTGYANAGDAMQSDVAKNDNYRSSLTFTSTDIREDNGVYSFDFWQMENKRSGIPDYCKSYQDREVEWKNGNLNTGVYKSLSPEKETLNNKATYVEIHAQLTYLVTDPVKNPDDAEPDWNLPDKVNSRTVEAVYIVHLGYVDGAADFNSLRNSIYTYKVKVLSASSIIVEAFRKDSEPQPGAEGLVSDVTEKMYNLDSHYNAFNVQLSETELENFSFSMRSYYGVNTYNYSTDEKGNSTGNPIPARGASDYRYLSWVEIVPTTGENDLAPYPGVDKGPDSTPLMKCDLSEVRANAGKLYDASTDGWFTVFVNEYTYEDESTNPGGASQNWHNYVMLPNRVAYLNVAQSVSDDQQSSYFRSKYAISQRSIQTYYDYANTEVPTAIGVEYDNETFGMNLRWPEKAVGTRNGATYPQIISTVGNPTALSVDNGRYNVWVGSEGTPGGNRAGAWNTYVLSGNASVGTYGQVNSVNKITNTNQNTSIGFEPSPKTWPVPQPVLLNPNDINTTPNFNGDKMILNGALVPVNDFDPQTDAATAQIIHAMHACMNRNRDNNGDGVIDANELRWYLPASGKYIRIIMGRNSLRNPILDYNVNITLPAGVGSGDNSRLFLATSDYRMVWTTQGMSLSNIGNYGYMPWSVRCIRNLGVDMTIVTANPEDDPVNAAYEVVRGEGNYSTGGIVKITNYYGTSLRNYTTEPIEMHKVNSDENKLGQYGFEIALRGNRTTDQSNEASVSFSSADDYIDAVRNADPCKDLNTSSGRTGWRIPNQKELVIMMSGEVFNNNQLRYQYFMSSTMTTWNNAGVSTGEDLGSRRVCSITRSDLGNGLGNNEATAQVYSQIGRVRCVRDLTPDEAGKTYEQIRNNR